MMILRPATPTDLPLVFKLERAYIEDFEPAASVGWHRVIDRHLQQWTENLSRMFVAQTGDESVGYYFWQPDGDQAILASVNILPTQRRKGVATSLLKHFEANAQAHGFSQLSLGVLHDNPARALYENAGYVFSHNDGSYRFYKKIADESLLAGL